MRRRLVGLAIVAFLAFPSAILAADPSVPTPAGRYFYIAAVEQGGKTTKVEGKLWIEGGQLGASVGCNSIGARVTFDGRTLTIFGSLTTTLMGCPADRAEPEAALVAALGAGPFIYDGTAFSGKGARILATEAGTTPAVPPDQKVPPDRPVGGPVIEPKFAVDPEACRRLVPAKEWEAAFGGGFGTDGGASSGSGGGSGGSNTSGGASGNTGITGGRTPAGPASEPKPAPSMAVEPDKGPQRDIAPAPGVIEPAPVDLPLPVAKDAKPRVIVNDGPLPTPSIEACRELLAQIRTMAASAPTVDDSNAGGSKTSGAGPGARDGAEMAAQDMARSTSVSPVLALLLVLAGGVLLILWLRSIPGRQTTP